MKDSEDERGRGGEREDWKAEGERERQSDRERRDIWNDSKGEGARQWERKKEREEEIKCGVRKLGRHQEGSVEV